MNTTGRVEGEGADRGRRRGADPRAARRAPPRRPARARRGARGSAARRAAGSARGGCSRGRARRRAGARAGRRPSAARSGNAARNSPYFGRTRSTWVCWSMTSETRIRYGSRVSRQGIARAAAAVVGPDLAPERRDRRHRVGQTPSLPLWRRGMRFVVVRRCLRSRTRRRVHLPLSHWGTGRSRAGCSPFRKGGSRGFATSAPARLLYSRLILRKKSFGLMCPSSYSRYDSRGSHRSSRRTPSSGSSSRKRDGSARSLFAYLVRDAA